MAAMINTEIDNEVLAYSAKDGIVGKDGITLLEKGNLWIEVRSYYSERTQSTDLRLYINGFFQLNAPTLDEIIESYNKIKDKHFDVVLKKEMFKAAGGDSNNPMAASQIFSANSDKGGKND